MSYTSDNPRIITPEGMGNYGIMNINDNYQDLQKQKLNMAMQFKDRYDKATQMYAAAMEKLGSVTFDNPKDQEAYTKWMASNGQEINNAVQTKYNGDTGAAMNVIMPKLASMSAIASQAKAASEAKKSDRTATRELEMSGLLMNKGTGNKYEDDLLSFDPSSNKLDVKQGDYSGYIRKDDYEKLVAEDLKSYASESEKKSLNLGNGVFQDEYLAGYDAWANSSDPKKRDQHRVNVLEAVKKLKKSTYQYTDEYKKEIDGKKVWDEDELYKRVDNILKGVYGTKSAYGERYQKNADRGNFGFGLGISTNVNTQGKYELISTTVQGMKEEYGIKTFNEFKEKAIETNDPAMLGVVQQFESSVVKNNKDYAETTRKIKQEKSRASNELNEAISKNPFLSSLNKEDQTALFNIIDNEDPRTLNNFVETKINSSQNKRGISRLMTSPDKVAAERSLRDIKTKHDSIKSKYKTTEDILNEEFDNQTFNASEYQAKIGEKEINTAVGDYVSGMLNKLTPGDADHSKKASDDQFGTFTEDAFNEISTGMKKNLSGINYRGGSRASTGAFVVKFDSPVKIDGKARTNVVLKLPKDPEKRMMMVRGFAIKSEMPQLAFQAMDGEFLNTHKPDDNGDIPLNGNYKLLKVPGSDGQPDGYAVSYNGQPYKETYSLSPTESIDNYNFYTRQPGTFKEEFLNYMVGKEYSTNKQLQSGYSQESSNFGAFNR